MTTKKVAIIQARMSSSRLPGKVLMPLLGLPSIVFMVHRVRQAKLVDEVVVATSSESSDDQLAQELQQHGMACFRGSLDDVLDRFHSAARQSQASHIVRLTGDCPLMDPDLIDRALALLQTEGVDYVSNVEPPTYPNGLDVEAFTFTALEHAWKEASLPSEREHVTPYLRKRLNGSNSRSWLSFADLSELRWTVDHQDDFDHINGMLNLLAPASPTSFTRFDLYRLLDSGQYKHQQPDHVRNEGYLKSLAQDPMIN